MPAAVIVDAVRTPIGLRGGALSGWHPVDLAAEMLRAIVVRNDLDPATVDDVILGCVMQVGSQSLNVARSAVLAAGWPDTVPGATVERQCGSSQQAVHFAAQAVAAGACDIVVAGGVEVMSTTPLGATTVPGALPFGPAVAARFRDVGGLVPHGVAAERLAEQRGYSRHDLDRVAETSFRRAREAAARGAFDAELVTIEGRHLDRDKGEVVYGRMVTGDEAVVAAAADLAPLRPVYVPDGVVTAGNAAPIADGSAAVLVMSEERASALGCAPLARLVGTAVGAGSPVQLDVGIGVTRRVLARAGLDLAAMEVIEVHESFAPLVLAWVADAGADPDRVNVNGGAIALGNPLGCSGARVLTTLVHELARRGTGCALQVMATAGGQAMALVVERP